MCFPAVGLALGIAGQVANFAAQQQAANAHNTAVLANAQSASLAATHKYEDEGRRLIYNQKQNQQEGYKAVMKGREAQGTVAASAGAAGWSAGSISLDSILANEANKTQLNLDNIRTKMDDTEDAYRSRVDTYYAEAQGRINSMPMKPGPSPLALGINIASQGLQGAKEAGWFVGT